MIARAPVRREDPGSSLASPLSACLPFGIGDIDWLFLQALAAMLCGGVYLLVHQIYRYVVVPRGREEQVTLVCCGAPMAEEKREKLVTRLTKIKAR